MLEFGLGAHERYYAFLYFTLTKSNFPSNLLYPFPMLWFFKVLFSREEPITRAHPCNNNRRVDIG